MMGSFRSSTVCLAVFLAVLLSLDVLAENRIPTGVPMTTDLAGRSGAVAVQALFRVLCSSKNKGGTGFLHKSGKVITAAHVVEGCAPTDLALVGASGQRLTVANIVTDAALDLALLSPSKAIDAPALPLSTTDEFSIGAQVSTWGYPDGYYGLAPLLSSGYLAGVDRVKVSGEKSVPRLVINAAFNLGNSGGPLLEIEKGTVIGVVSSKVVPLPPDIESALAALKMDKSIMAFEKTSPDGTKEKKSISQLLEEVLQYMRSQTQLVIGHAVMPSDLKAFLKSNGIDP